uniref:SFRICE_014598 n=1 Tax=Spodoptera frugiperda TaxID=7108 RepID=A0A2H1VJM1_SPOFR
MLFFVFTYKMPRKRKCYYYMCQNTSDDGMPAFRFPVDDPDRLQKWILNSGNALLKSLPKQLLRNRYICVMHFQPNDFKEGFERCKLIGMPCWQNSDCSDDHRSLVTDVDLGSETKVKEEMKVKEETKDVVENTPQPVQPENESQEGNTSFRDKSQRLKNKKAFLAKRSKCTVPQCNGEVSSEISLHLCPNNPAVRNEWAEAFNVRYSYVKTLVACSQHFTKLDFIQSKNSERVLKHNAVPSRNLPKKDTDLKSNCVKKYVPSSVKKSNFQKQIMNNNASDEDPPEEKEEKVLQECRACLKKLNDKQSVCNIFQPWALPWKGMEPTIAEDLAKLANIEVSQTDRHTKVLCEPCYQKLRDAATFASAVRNCDLVLRMRFTAEIDMERVWPKPIQVDKNLNGSVYTDPMNVEIKQEVVTDDEYPANGPENPYVETELANLDIKIEPEEFVEPPPLNITINGTISLDPLNSENRELINGTQLEQETTQFIEMPVKQEPASEGEQEFELPPDLPLECMLCAKPFHSVSGLKAHVIAHHSYKSVKRKSDGSVSPEKKRFDKYRCGICHTGFSTSTDLMVHETCHNKYACYACSRKFDSFPLLTRHRKRCKATVSNSVQKLKTLEDVKRPAVEDILKDFDDAETIDELEAEVDPPLSTESQENTQEQDNTIDTSLENSELGQDKLTEGQNEQDKLIEGQNEQDTEEQPEAINEDVEMKDLDSNREVSNEEIQEDSESKSQVEDLRESELSETVGHITDASDVNVDSDKNTNHSESCVILDVKSKVDEDSDNMKLHLEIHSANKETEPAVNDVDVAIGTMENDDCT